jgi:sialate O-acetylesterase
LSILASGAPVWSDIKLPRAIGDHMVLQREMATPIWGTADANEKVFVKFRDQQKQTMADSDGNWMVKLDALKAGGPDRPCRTIPSKQA